jgi:hypothetical protein
VPQQPGIIHGVAAGEGTIAVISEDTDGHVTNVQEGQIDDPEEPPDDAWPDNPFDLDTPSDPPPPDPDGGEYPNPDRGGPQGPAIMPNPEGGGPQGPAFAGQLLVTPQTANGHGVIALGRGVSSALAGIPTIGQGAWLGA